MIKREYGVNVEKPVEVLDLEGRRLAGIVAAPEQVTDHAVHHLVALFAPKIVSRPALDLALFGYERLVLLELLGQGVLCDFGGGIIPLGLPSGRHLFRRLPCVAERNLHGGSIARQDADIRRISPGGRIPRRA